jgi:hypothetical protein
MQKRGDLPLNSDRYDVPGYDTDVLRVVDEMKEEFFPTPGFKVGGSSGMPMATRCASPPERTGVETAPSAGCRTIGHGTGSMARVAASALTKAATGIAW